MHRKLSINSKIFQGQSFTNIFPNSKLWYNVVILTKVNPDLFDILEILKLYTHLSTTLSNCPYCVESMDRILKLRYFDSQ